MIDFSKNFRRGYSPLDKDRLSAVDNIGDWLDILNDTLSRIADALEKLTDTPAADTDKNEPAAALEAVRAVPERAANPETLLKTLDEKSDAALDTPNLIAGAVAPNAAFALRQFSDGNGRFLPTDATPTETPATDA